MLDVGCGKGVSTSWFVTHELDFVQCVEGSHDAVTQSIVPNSKEHVVEHDFSRGKSIGLDGLSLSNAVAQLTNIILFPRTMVARENS